MKVKPFSKEEINQAIKAREAKKKLKNKRCGNCGFIYWRASFHCWCCCHPEPGEPVIEFVTEDRPACKLYKKSKEKK